MYRNASFDIITIIISCFMLINFSTHKKIPLTQNKIYILLVCVNMLSALFNTLYAGIFLLNPDIPFFPELFITGYFISHLLCAPLMMIYIFSFAISFKEISKSARAAISMPVALGELLVLTNPFTHIVFGFNEEHIYIRNFGIWIVYAIAGFYFVYIIIWIIRHKNKMLASYRNHLILLICFSLLSIAFQYFYPKQLVESCATAICLLVQFLTIQNPHECFDNSSGAFNHRTFILLIGSEYAAEKEFAVIVLVFDDLSAIDSAFGAQQMGVAESEIVSFLGSIDKKSLVYRMDSRVFCLKIPYMEKEKTENYVNLIHSRFARSWKIEDGETIMSARTCLIYCPADAKTADELAEIISCSSRRKTGMQINYASDINLALFRRERYIESIIANVFKENSLEIIYIPVYSFKKNRIVFAEASLRIYDKELGYISAEEFLHIAESTKAIIKIGEYMFDKVCRFIADGRLLERGIEVVSLRISAVQWMHPELVSRFGEIKRKYNIPNSSICFNVAENVVASTKDSFAENILTLSSDGVRFCLSEYGTGFTNISYVYDLPFDFIKIDKNVTNDSIINKKAYLTLESTMQLIKELGMDTMIDGVDDEQMFNTVSDMPCDFAQGRFFSRAFNELEFIDFITNFEAPQLTVKVGGENNAV